jgi:phenylalanine-4-hydroxylase
MDPAPPAEAAQAAKPGLPAEAATAAKPGLPAEAATAAKAGWVIDQGWERYTRAEHAIWNTLFTRQAELLPGLACREFLSGLQALDIAPDRIPDFRRLNERLERRTGWNVVAVPGLVPDEVFFDLLANRRFPAGNFIRPAQLLDYLPEPDVFHDVFGHVPMLMHPVFADYMQAYGEGGMRALRLGALDRLARVYWYTVEFGLVREDGELRIYGAGIVSSHRESVFSLRDDSPNRIAFELGRVLRTRYRIDDFQEMYFVLPGLEALLELANVDFAPWYERVAHLPDLDPGVILDSDEVITRGTRQYTSTRPSPALRAGEG